MCHRAPTTKNHRPFGKYSLGVMEDIAHFRCIYAKSLDGTSAAAYRLWRRIEWTAPLNGLSPEYKYMYIHTFTRGGGGW